MAYKQLSFQQIVNKDVGQQLVNCQPTVGQQLIDSGPTIAWLSVEGSCSSQLPWVLLFKPDKEAIMKEEREEKLSDQHGKISFFCGNPMVEIIKGIIHIYKNK